MLAKIHLKPGYLILGYKEEAGGWGVASPKKSDEERVFIFYRSYGSNGQIPPDKALPPAPLKDEQTFIGLQDHRSSELALNHEKFRAIKKKLRW